MFLFVFRCALAFLLAQVSCLRICKSQRKTMLEHKLNKCEIFYRYVCQAASQAVLSWAACTKKQITFHRLVHAEQLILLCVLSHRLFLSLSLTHTLSLCVCFRLALTYPQQSCPHDRKLSGTKAPRRTLHTDSDPSTVGWPSAARRQCPLSFATAGEQRNRNRKRGK